ncbi:MAG: ATP synthase F1 subunit delta [Sandaracinaceae bacterium]
MIGSTVAKRYARALYDLAVEKSTAAESPVESVQKSLRALADAWTTSADLRNVFENPRFGLEQKRAVMKTLTERVAAHVMVKNVAQMLTDRRRLRYLPEIADAFELLAEQRSGRIRAEIVSAQKLPEAYYQRLTQTLKEATGKDVVLVRREDPSLIGGVVTTVGGRVYDGSLKNRLRGLESELLSASAPTSRD